MQFKQVHKITSWVIFLLALTVYTITMEKSASFWDCGEFIAAAFKLQTVHPPGAPLFLMLGRLFTLPFPAEQAAIGVNFMSAIATSFAALFVYLSTTIFAKRIFTGKLHDVDSSSFQLGDQIAIIGSGIVATFAFVFQDTQWFNAVEAEVYALSTLLTSAVFYMGLKWSEQADKPGADRWLIAIFFVVGLSIGVHLLNLLVIPAITLLVYFFRAKNHTIIGGVSAFIIGAAVLLFIQYGVILEFPKIGSGFEIIFVNNFSLPFGTGLLTLLIIVFLIPVFLIIYIHKQSMLFFYAALSLLGVIALSLFHPIHSGVVIKLFFILALGGAIYYLKNHQSILHRVSLGFLFVMIGYMSYIMVPIRSAANTPIDIWNPENVFSLMSYLNREQYGDKPLLYGPMFTAEPIDLQDKADQYVKTADAYKVSGAKKEYVFNAEDKMLFPRAWNHTRPEFRSTYQSWMNLGPDEKPTMTDNLAYFFKYQLDFMYWRYFMWNFAGRQNVQQGYGNADRGNWVSGIPLADAGRVVQSNVYPDYLGNNPSVNYFYLLPFVFGLIGIIFHFIFHRKDAIVLSIFFLITGVAIIIYLNQSPNEPRERDYVYAGSFIAYAMWIGLSVIGFYKALRTIEIKEFAKKLATGLVSVFAALFLLGFGANNIDTLFGILITIFIIAAILFFIGYGLKSLSAKTQAAGLTIVIALAPLLMGVNGWQEHNRNNLALAASVGKNYIGSTMPNSILFTEGDNDTYPLWYAQDVENYRTDVKLVNNSLLQADWYADQMQQHNGFQPGLTFSFKSEDYSGKRDYIYYYDRTEEVPYLELNDVLRFIKSDDTTTKLSMRGNSIDYFPTKTFILPIDKEKQIENGLLSTQEAQEVDSIMVIQLDENKSSLVRDEYLIFDIINQYINKRPIYFTSPGLPMKLGLYPYIRKEGASYRLYPKMQSSDGSPALEKDRTLDLLQNTFTYGNVESGVFLEETGQRQMGSLLRTLSSVIEGYATENKTDQAMQAYQIVQDKILPSSLYKDEPYNMYEFLTIGMALLEIGETQKAESMLTMVSQSAVKNLEYMQNTGNLMVSDKRQINNAMIDILKNIKDIAKEEQLLELQKELSNISIQ